MNHNPFDWQSLIAGLYAWIITVFFGAILLDVAYAGVLRAELPSASLKVVFSQGSDFLLLIGVLTVFTGVMAIAVSWNNQNARNLFIASLLILGIEFIVPMFFLQAVKNLQASTGLNLGSWIRLLVNAMASILAIIGFWKMKSNTLRLVTAG